MSGIKILDVCKKNISSFKIIKNEEYQTIIDKNNELINENKQLKQHISQLNNHIKKLEKENTEIMAKLLDLKAKTNKNSTNSSKPPSSDSYKKKKKVTNSRKKTKNKSGGQEGHEGTTLNKVENPDKVIHIPLAKEICECGQNLLELDIRTITRQVFEFLVDKFVTEYAAHKVICKCGKIHSSKFPEHVTQPTQYGSGAKAIMSLLSSYHFIPLERCSELLEDLFGIKPSQGTIVNTNMKLSELVQDSVNQIKEQIIKSKVVHFDESGFRDNGVTKWMHVASTEYLTHYIMHKSRGYEGVSHSGILSKLKGTAVHDHWKTYYKFKECNHSECNAHNIRYLIDIYENYNQLWADKMIKLLIEIKDRVESLKEAGFDLISIEEGKGFLDRYHQIIEEGILEDETKSPVVISKKTGKPKNSKALNLLNKLKDYDIETLAFMFDFNIPFDNNLAERDVRMQKLRQKISGSFRGEGSAEAFCAIRSYLSTARKNGIRVFEAIKRAFAREPFVPVIET